MLRILHDTRIDFIRLWRRAALASALLILPGLVLAVVRGFNYSIEFTGGTLLQMEFAQAPDVGEVRRALSAAGLTGVEISTFGSPRELVMRAQEERHVEEQAGGATSIATRIRAALDRRFGPQAYTVVRSEAVGPRVGGELRRQAAVAMVIAFALTLLYLAWRFEWRFSLAAVLATVHDILATLAFIRYMNIEISLFVVGGILTVIGYSMNDTVVVFDRVRENLRLSRRESLYEILNRSVNETLPRTVMTGSTTLASLLALLLLGGEVIRPFAWVLTFGIIIGTFSSVYVAAPVLLWIERRWPRQESERGGGGARIKPRDPQASAPPAAASPPRAANVRART
ncbi:MAG TPA: protein translocase subunit SecF [Gemmatimonadaceae bacterium]|nr:protein translocase subunit SecF [Gemmatimonadaceae bacterium]